MVMDIKESDFAENPAKYIGISRERTVAIQGPDGTTWMVLGPRGAAEEVLDREIGDLVRNGIDKVNTAWIW